MKQLLTILALLLLAACTKKEETPHTVLSKVKDNYDQHSSISYTINYKQKFFDGADTLQRNASCKLIRDTSDTLFAGYVWFRTTDSFERYYDLKNIYLIDHPNQKITEYKAHENQIRAITGNIAGSVIRVHFMETGQLLLDLKDSSNKATLMSDKNHFIVTLKYPDEEDFSEIEKNIWVRKNDFVMDKITYKVKFKGDYQYNEWNLSNIEFDGVSIADLEKSIQSYNQLYSSEQYLPPTTKDYETLKLGTLAPSFTGINFQNGKELSLEDFKGKLLILDFSYMSCMPCIKAIPHLNQIQKEYGDKNVLVLAINSKDTDEKAKKRLPDFINKHFVNYPIILTSSQTDGLYNVKAYPTLYAIDEKGKIIYAQMGFSDKVADSLKLIIEKQLK